MRPNLVYILSVTCLLVFVMLYTIQQETIDPWKKSRRASLINKNKNNNWKFLTKKLHVNDENAMNFELPAKQNCGDICNTTIKGKKSMFFDFIEKSVNCHALWTNKFIDTSRAIGPATFMPSKFVKDYTYDFRIPVKNYSRGLLNQQYAGGNAQTPVWSISKINLWQERCRNGILDGNYGRETTKTIFKSLKNIPTIKNGTILVVGSENPWIEACILAAGAKHVTTIEYGAINNHHHQISTLIPDQARDMYYKNTLGLFDVIVSFSSVEHSGLGRYGDALNPWGDLQAVARMWCVCKPGGYLLLGVMEGKDTIVWNAHRQYGNIMFPHLVANWEQKWRDGHLPQRVYVFQKTS